MAEQLAGGEGSGKTWDMSDAPAFGEGADGSRGGQESGEGGLLKTEEERGRREELERRDEIIEGGIKIPGFVAPFEWEEGKQYRYLGVNYDSPYTGSDPDKRVVLVAGELTEGETSDGETRYFWYESGDDEELSEIMVDIDNQAWAEVDSEYNDDVTQEAMAYIAGRQAEQMKKGAYNPLSLLSAVEQRNNVEDLAERINMLEGSINDRSLREWKDGEFGEYYVGMLPGMAGEARGIFVAVDSIFRNIRWNVENPVAAAVRYAREVAERQDDEDEKAGYERGISEVQQGITYDRGTGRLTIDEDWRDDGTDGVVDFE
jgi:hypothetical protein